MRDIIAPKALLVENNEEDAHSIREMFSDQGSCGFELTHVASIDDAEMHLTKLSVDIVLLALELPDARKLEAVRRLRSIAPHLPIVVLSRLDNETAARHAIEEGAQDYLIKGQLVPRGLMRTLSNALGRKSLEVSLLKEKERAQLTLNCIGDAIICTDLAGNITFLNPIAEGMTGWSLQEVAGRPLADAFRLMDAATHLPAPDPMTRPATDRNSGPTASYILVRRDGNEIFIEDSVAPLRDRDGLAAGSVLVFHDVTVARALAAQITQLAERDPLTGLPNRLLLSDRIGQAIAHARRDAGLVAVLYLDLDGFKRVNDSLGHPAGDKLLQSVAKRLLECVRTPDTVSRQGGDEFVLLLQGVIKPEDAAYTARRILKAVSEPHSINGHSLHVTASIGVSIYPNDGQDAETLTKNADTAMYQAKESGRQTYKFFTPEMNVKAVDRQSIEEDLRCALERKELSLHYQPKINLKTKAIVGAEALLRWTHPTRGSISPSRFIPVAEDTGMILSIGAWVLREACTQARAWADAGLPVAAISVNISSTQFRNEDFLPDLFATLDETGLNPQTLDLEVTESALMRHPELTASVLKILREEGVRVAVDNFGTGYSNLSYLRQFPIDALKIDQSLTGRIAAKPNDAGIVSAIIAMGQNLNLRVIAEGVETAEDLAFLKAQDCDEAQGFYFSRPVPPAEFARLLTH